MHLWPIQSFSMSVLEAKMLWFQTFNLSNEISSSQTCIETDLSVEAIPENEFVQK